MRNANISDWPLEPWQMAKVYMDKGQKQASVDPSETDASGILQLMLNCKRFKGIVDITKVAVVRIFCISFYLVWVMDQHSLGACFRDG